MNPTDPYRHRQYHPFTPWVIFIFRLVAPERERPSNRALGGRTDTWHSDLPTDGADDARGQRLIETERIAYGKDLLAA